MAFSRWTEIVLCETMLVVWLASSRDAANNEGAAAKKRVDTRPHAQ
jgi:hypothetical protein